MSHNFRAAQHRVAIGFTLVRTAFLVASLSSEFESLGVGLAVVLVATSIFPIAAAGVVLYYALGKRRAIGWAIVYGLIDSAALLASTLSPALDTTSFVANLIGSFVASVAVYFALDILADTKILLSRLAIAVSGILAAALVHSGIATAIIGDSSRFVTWPDLGWAGLKGICLFLAVQVLWSLGPRSPERS